MGFDRRLYVVKAGWIRAFHYLVLIHPPAGVSWVITTDAVVLLVERPCILRCAGPTVSAGPVARTPHSLGNGALSPGSVSTMYANTYSSFYKLIPPRSTEGGRSCTSVSDRVTGVPEDARGQERRDPAASVLSDNGWIIPRLPGGMQHAWLRLWCGEETANELLLAGSQPGLAMIGCLFLSQNDRELGIGGPAGLDWPRRLAMLRVSDGDGATASGCYCARRA
ncbi:hypothetical protein BDY21DRAFT_18109 [Lineolata rhizophorae]|uniref:Uncharacterized protein n=1 Tax=Lineolata rhizophorae TaxID=578093 RepID=A0A6A6P256_9PEZI|nr:hypothetical protein BDY21DRAFT_18109 [Lineolata rhizophorae]